MSRGKTVTQRRQLHVYILEAQAKQIKIFEELYEKNKTAIVEEALQYWINEQYRLYGDRLKVQ